MHKESREKAWKATSQARTKPINENTNIDADIVNLNHNNDFIPVTEEVEVEEVAPLTEEEKREVRKKLFILLVAIVIALLVMIVMLIFDPFGGKDKEKEKDKPIVQEEKEDDKEETKKSLKDIKDGTVNLAHEELVKLIEIVEFNNNENLFNDTVSLFSTTPALTSKLSNKNKLFLTTKSEKFKKMFETKITNNNVCSSELNIPTTEMSKLVKEVLNTDVSEYISFYYSYYDGTSYINDIIFKKENDLYIGECIKTTPQPKALVQQSILGANKENKKVNIDVKIVFVNQTGVYKDPNFKTLITNDKNVSLDNYISEGNTYRYTFNVSSDNYYLESISLLK